MTPREAIQVIQREQGKIRATIAKNIRSSVIRADDLMQEGFIKLLLLNPSAQIEKPTQYFLTTCFRIAAEETVKAIRQRDKLSAFELEEPASPGPTPEEELQSEQFINHIEKQLQACSPRCRRVFEMSFIEGYKYAETAKHFRVSESMIKKYLETAKKRIEGYEVKLRPCDVAARAKRQAGFGESSEGRARARSSVGRKI